MNIAGSSITSFLCLVAVSGFCQAKLSPADEKLLANLLAAHTVQQQELITRSAVGDRSIDRYISVYRSAYARNHEPILLYGLMRLVQHAAEFSGYMGNGLSYQSQMAVKGQLHDLIPLNEAVIAKLGNNAAAVAGYYRRVAFLRETTLPPPKMSHEWKTITHNGRPIQVQINRTIADPAKEKRLDELFAKAWKLDPHDPFVLQIAAEREKDPAKRYALMTEAYERGGKDFFPEEALYTLWSYATKLVNASAVSRHKHQLDAWLAANERSVWEEVFRIRHRDFPLRVPRTRGERT